jgi:pimeloyl-ACP methyl ester carboxylesterase
LFLLHGWGDAGRAFQFLVDTLARDWFVVAPDWRGFGNSFCRVESYWFPDYVADLDALLEIYSQDAPARLLGHSMGANIAGLYAGVMPERVSSFVNVEGFGLADSKPENAPAHYRRWIEAGREMRGYASYRSFEELVPKILKRSPRMTADRALFVAKSWARETENGVELKADPAHKLPNAVQYRRAEAMACRAAVTARVLESRRFLHRRYASFPFLSTGPRHNTDGRANHRCYGQLAAPFYLSPSSYFLPN